MDPDKMEGVRGIVDVFNLFKTIKRVIHIIQCNINYKIDLLLPIPGL